MDTPRIKELIALRKILDGCFDSSIRHPGFDDKPPSRGCCAVVAVMLHELCGWDIVTCKVGTISHWLNRFTSGKKTTYIDLTADQFGYDAIVVSDELPYPATRPRKYAKKIGKDLDRRVDILHEKVMAVCASLNPQ
jgi:hypothetical protein